MLTTERHQIILKMLTDKSTVTLKEITDATRVSESTIRRDLVELENQRKLTRVHGGAILPNRKATELSYKEKSIKSIQEKNVIAKYTAEMIEKDDCIYLDAGSTTYKLIPYLVGKNVIVVTNGLSHVDKLMEYDITTYVTGGAIKGNTRALIGAEAIRSLQAYRFDKCFLGVNGFHAEYGYTTPDPEEAAVKRQASALAKETYILADVSKYEQVSFSKIIDLNQGKLITNKLSKKALRRLQKHTTVKELTT